VGEVQKKRGRRVGVMAKGPPSAKLKMKKESIKQSYRNEVGVVQ